MNKKIKTILIAIHIMSILLMIGCGKEINYENNEVNPNWKIRYENIMQQTGENAKTRVELSVDVYKELSEDEYIEILEKCESRNGVTYVDSEDGKDVDEYFCYAVFFKGDTDEIIRKVKYHNHEYEEYLKNEESLFPIAAYKN